QPQMALGGYPMLGSPAVAPATGWDPAPPLSDYLNVQSPGWSPTPDPAATSAGLGRLQTYWKDAEGADMMWQQTGHDGSAAQYPDWAIEGHANALTGLTSQPFWGFLDEATKKECLDCHSADYRILEEAGENPTSADAMYGITCVGCHTPHENTTEGGAWDEEWTPQLRTGSAKTLCVECHNGEIPEGTTAAPGTEVHHPMKEMMEGYGAIDVSSFPSVHKDKCVECHMPPTSVSRGSVQLGGNHTFNIIEPEVALEASPIPVVTTSAVATASPSGTITTTNTVTWDSMPYSACSTCHSNNNGVRATPRPISTTTATPNPTASPLRVTVTINQTANQAAWGNSSGGDRAVWLQDTIEQRQDWTKAKIAEIWAVLEAVAVDNGYADAQAARDALVDTPSNTWTTTVRAFLSSFTNVEFVESEGSFGLHNWDYSREIVNKAMMQAKIAESGVLVKLPYKVTFKISKSPVKAGAKVTFSGTVKTAKGVAAAGTVKIMKRVGGVWKVWQRTTLKSDGSYKLTKKMTTKGSFYMRGLMPADSLNLTGYSKQVKLVVK
ncbi:MAG: multiheme c-type cytochrome, partial [Deltaproteobacteria bacterium]